MCQEINQLIIQIRITKRKETNHLNRLVIFKSRIIQHNLSNKIIWLIYQKIIKMKMFYSLQCLISAKHLNTEIQKLSYQEKVNFNYFNSKINQTKVPIMIQTENLRKIKIIPLMLNYFNFRQSNMIIFLLRKLIFIEYSSITIQFRLWQE